VNPFIRLVVGLIVFCGVQGAQDLRAQSQGASAQGEEITRVFLFAGQSNMVGADAHAERIDDYPDFRGAGAPQKEVLFSYIVGNGQEASKGWGPLKPLSSFGPELTFARKVQASSPGPIAIIKSAVGGTTIAFDWNPDAPEKGQKLYPRTLNLIRESLQELEKRGIRYRLEGVMWHQGENDMLDRKLYKDYAAGLNRLVSRLREDLKAPQLKWYLAEVSEKGIWGMDHRANLGIFRQQQEVALKADTLLRWIPTSHLAFEVMGSGQPHYHYGTQGQLQLGEAFASSYLKEIGKGPVEPDPRVKDPLAIPPKGRVRLFVLAGQRNMEGEDSYVSEIAGFPEFASLAKAQEKILFRYCLGGGVKKSPDWEPLGPTSYLGNFGPELSMGAKLRKSIDPSNGIALVKFTHSGAQGPDWFPKGTVEAHRNLYPKLIAFLRQAKEDLEKKGYECTIEGVFWHTGENDTYFGPYVNNHSQWMKQLIGQVRLDLNQPELSWYLSEQHPRAPWGNIEKVNKSLADLAASDSRITIIKTAALPHAKHHFGTNGTMMLGEEMANAWIKNQ